MNTFTGTAAKPLWHLLFVTIIPILQNKYVAAILFLLVTFILASPSFGGTWFYIWALFGGSNQLMAGLALMIITLWLIDTKTEEIRKLLTAPEFTAFYFVALPLALPISVMERFIYWVRAFLIPVGGVIVNQVMSQSDPPSSFIVNKQVEQKRYLDLVDKKFGDLVAARIPMLDGEIRTVEMKVSLSDTGIGIKDENLSKLFQKFEQLDPGISQKYGGIGLGLAITKQLVEMHGGKIWVESKYGEGTTVTFLIPKTADKPKK